MEPSSIQVMIEDNHSISTLVSVKSSNVGMKSVSTWKLEQKLKSYVHLKQLMEAEPLAQLLPTLIWSSPSKEFNDSLKMYILIHSFFIIKDLLKSNQIKRDSWDQNILSIFEKFVTIKVFLTVKCQKVKKIISISSIRVSCKLEFHKFIEFIKLTFSFYLRQFKDIWAFLE